MDCAEGLILEKGFNASSIDQIIDRAGMTKGTFFYHFKNKADLAYALVERFAAADADHLNGKMDRAEKLSRDPLQQVLIFVGLFLEEAEQLSEPYPGCLFASYVQEAQLFDDRTLGIIERAIVLWRERFGAKLQQVIDMYPPRREVSAASLADMITVVFEGAFVFSKMMSEAGTVADQLVHYRNYLELLFLPEPEPAE